MQQDQDTTSTLTMESKKVVVSKNQTKRQRKPSNELKNQTERSEKAILPKKRSFKESEKQPDEKKAPKKRNIKLTQPSKKSEVKDTNSLNSNEIDDEG